MKFKKLNLEYGMYKEARDHKDSKGNARPLSFSGYLELQDPSENYPGTKLDAFQRQLAARGLIVEGPRSIQLGEFYDPDNIVLFPEFISREVRAGMVLGRTQLMVSDIIAVSTTIPTGAYNAAFLDMSQDFSHKEVAEGSDFPVLQITTANKPITLKKYGFTLKESYEHRRRIQANKFAVFLRVVGQHLELDRVELAVNVLINGNTGNSNAATVDSISGLNYNNMIDFWAEFNPYEPNVLVAPKAGITSILKLTEFKDPQAGFNFQRTGDLVTPLGNMLKRHDTSQLSSKVLGVDAGMSLELVEESGADMVEAESIIQNQTNDIVVSNVFGFAKMFADATHVWDYS